MPELESSKSKTKNPLRWLPLRAFLWLALGAAFVSLFRSTLGQATDFEVFWRVGQALRDHAPLYDVTREGGMVFKYPPWIATLFLPFGWIDFVTSKGLWALIELLSLLSVIWSLRRDFGVSELSLVVLFPLYWGIWVIHFLDGQVMLPVLAMFLFFVSKPRLAEAMRGFIPILMSIKVFTLFPLLAMWERFKGRRAIYAFAMFGLGLTGATAYLSFQSDVPAMMHAWSDAAASGARYLDPGKTRGSKNQSLVSYACRLTNVPADDSRTEVILSALLFVAAFAFLRWRRTDRAQARFGDITTIDYIFMFLALTPPFHPLPWHHLYVWTFPLAVYRFDRDYKRLFYWVAIALLTLSSDRGLPLLGIGDFLENNVGRAWGALLLVLQATVLIRVPSPISSSRRSLRQCQKSDSAKSDNFGHNQ
ncbi:MAG: DUF2029 domain-containing protein [Bdellovibrionales bacterium]|nr:DUF2029 domain-containing protein [Bdellovibrionales bacterium]